MWSVSSGHQAGPAPIFTPLHELSSLGQVVGLQHDHPRELQSMDTTGDSKETQSPRVRRWRLPMRTFRRPASLAAPTAASA